jgi:hypothetical protein
MTFLTSFLAGAASLAALGMLFVITALTMGWLAAVDGTRRRRVRSRLLESACVC